MTSTSDVDRDAGGEDLEGPKPPTRRRIRLLMPSEPVAEPDPVADDGDPEIGRYGSIPMGHKMAREMLAGRYIHVSGIGWHRWDGRRWQECRVEHVRVDAAKWAEQLFASVVASGADETEQKLVVRYREVQGVNSLIEGAKTVGSTVLVDANQLDAHPLLLNCSNGIVDLTTGELLAHDPAKLFTKVTAAPYVQGARHRDWDIGLEAFADEETMRWSQQYLGTGCTGLTPAEDIVPFWHGGGSNGKSTILGGVEAALGEYSMALSKTLLGGRREEHPTQMMDLRGLRLGFMEETAEGHRLDTVRMKEIVGTDVIKARRMRQDYVTFTASHTLVITTNYRPVVTDTDHGTWRRLRMVPFPKKYGDDGGPVDVGLRARIRNGQAQQEAVLAWLVEGAVAWVAAGCKLPAEPGAVVEETRIWRSTGDLIFAFAEERLEAAPGEQVEVEEVREAFNDWLQKPHQPWGRQVFAERFAEHPALKELGVTRGLAGDTRRAVFKGMVLKSKPGGWRR